MKLTLADRMFWLHRKLPVALRDPKWTEQYGGIDAVINGHVETKGRVNTDLHNALSLLGFAGRNGNPGRIGFMLQIIRNNHPTSAGRIRYYKRWVRRFWGTGDHRIAWSDLPPNQEAS